MKLLAKSKDYAIEADSKTLYKVHTQFQPGNYTKMLVKMSQYLCQSHESYSIHIANVQKRFFKLKSIYTSTVMQKLVTLNNGPQQQNKIHVHPNQNDATLTPHALNGALVNHKVNFNIAWSALIYKISGWKRLKSANVLI